MGHSNTICMSLIPLITTTLQWENIHKDSFLVKKIHEYLPYILVILVTIDASWRQHGEGPRV